MQIAQIRDLIFKEIFGHASAHEQASLAAWLDESPANGELFEKLRSAGFLGKAITDDNHALKGMVRKNIGGGYGRRPLHRRALGIAAAAAILVVVCLDLLITDAQNGGIPLQVADAALPLPSSSKIVVTLPGGREITFDRNENISLVSDGHTVVAEGGTLYLDAGETAESEDDVVYTVPVGGEHTVRLADGTRVTMNSKSELRAPARFGHGERTIRFEGEGYFEVVHDSGRPFTVKTERADIVVLGTEFNLKSYKDDSETVATLVSGSVSLHSDLVGQVTMTPGTQARVNDSGKVSVEVVDIYPYTAWRSGRIVFYNARTEDIMKVLERWYDFEVRYADDAVKERRLTMNILKYDDIGQVLDLMAKVDVRCTVREREIILASE